jgi:hypothetical protein
VRKRRASGCHCAKSDSKNILVKKRMRVILWFMRAVVIAAVLCALTGCASERAVLVNNQGDRITCETAGGGLFGAASVGYEQRNCIAEAQQRGYQLQN